MTMYDEDFYREQQEDSLKSARAVVPLVLQYIQPRSVVDVGCGVGTWLSVFKENGIDDILGVDGKYVQREMLHIHPEEFRPFDLTQELRLDRRFDLAMSLEVAEHLPGDVAATFVKTMTQLAPVVLFSAAIPHQGGVNHINEQWPDYWRDLFEAGGFIMIDCLRTHLWDIAGIKPHYAQNMFFFVDKDDLEAYPSLKRSSEGGDSLPLCVVHPGIYEFKIHRLTEDSRLRPGNYRLGDLLGALPGFALSSVKSTVKRVLLRVCNLLGVDATRLVRRS